MGFFGGNVPLYCIRQFDSREGNQTRREIAGGQHLTQDSGMRKVGNLETYCDHNEHALRHVEGMSPVVIRHSSIVLPHSQKPAAQNLQEDRHTGEYTYKHTTISQDIFQGLTS